MQGLDFFFNFTSHPGEVSYRKILRMSTVDQSLLDLYTLHFLLLVRGFKEFVIQAKR